VRVYIALSLSPEKTRIVELTRGKEGLDRTAELSDEVLKSLETSGRGRD